MSGEAVPPGSSRRRMCEGLRLMYDNLRVLGELRERQEKVMAEALQLQVDMNQFKEAFTLKVDKTLEKTPLKIRPRKEKVDIDADFSGQNFDLPSPMVPMRLHLDGTAVKAKDDVKEVSPTEQRDDSHSDAPPEEEAPSVPPTDIQDTSATSANYSLTVDTTLGEDEVSQSINDILLGIGDVDSDGEDATCDVDDIEEDADSLMDPQAELPIENLSTNSEDSHFSPHPPQLN